MLSYFKYFLTSTAAMPKHANCTLFSKLYGRCQQIPSNFYNHSSDEGNESASVDSSDADMAPIDVNPWIDEELEKGGTIDMEYLDKEKEEIHYPEPTKERSGYYEFEGISIWLPKKMLTPATYRYRMTEEEQQTLPDDIRICKFENFKPTS